MSQVLSLRYWAKFFVSHGGFGAMAPAALSKGFPRTGASNKGRSEKFSDFLALNVNISKTVADTAKVTISE